MYPKRLSFLFVGFLVFLLLKSSSSHGRDSQEDDVSEDDEEDNCDGLEGSTGTDFLLQKKYYFALSDIPVKTYDDFLPDLYNCTFNQTCDVDSDCDKCFPNLEMAFKYGIKDIPHRPFCPNKTASEEEGVCTCGIGMCFSYSTDMATRERFYYCGACGYVGASCRVHPCSHPLAECRDGFCECTEDGIFYNLAFCYIPYFGAKVIVQMFISTLIIISLCGVMAYSYHRLSSSRRRYFRRFHSWRRRSSVVMESPTDDIPPTYDEVVDKVPSYQDALEMENSNKQGKDNPAFTNEEEGLPPSYEESAAYLGHPTGASSEEGISEDTNKPTRLKGDDIEPGSHSSRNNRARTTSSSEEQPIGQPIREALSEYRQ